MASGNSPHQSQVKAVIFDFGGVLCFHPSPEQISHAAQSIGVPAANFERALWTNRIEYDAGRVEPETYWSQVAALALSPAADAVRLLTGTDANLWNRHDERVIAWARMLRERGFRTAILSNLPRRLGHALRARPGFLEHFDHITFSYELGFVKPQREIYEDAVRGLGLRPAEALFLDDRPDNVEGALKAGLLALLYKSWEEFLASDPASHYGLPMPAGAVATARRQ